MTFTNQNRLRSFFLILLAISAFLNAQAQQNTDSLKAVLQTVSGSEKFYILSDLCWAYCYTDLDQSYDYSKEELSLARKLDNDTLLGIAYNDLGRSYHRYGTYDSALFYYEKSLSIRIATKDTLGQASSLSKMAGIYSLLKQSEKSIPLFQECIRIYMDQGDSLRMALMQNNLTQENLHLGNLDEAISSAERAIAYFSRIDYPDGLGVALNNMSLYYHYKEDYRMSNRYLFQVAAIYSALEYTQEEATIYNDIGSNYSLLSQHDSSVWYHKKALAVAKENDFLHDQALFGSNVGLELMALNQPGEAKSFFDHSYSIALQEKLPDALLNDYLGLYEYYSQQPQQIFRDSARYYIQTYLALNDSLYNEDKHRNISELQLKYETAQKDRELLEKENQNARIALELETQKRLIFMIVGVAVLLLALIGFFYYRKQQQQKLRIREVRIEEQQKGIEAIIEAEERQRGKIARDLHDSVGQSLSALILNIKELEKEAGGSNLFDRVRKSLDITEEVYQDVRGISHEMMPSSLQSSGLKEAIELLLKKTFEHTQIEYNFDTTIENRRFGERIELGLFRVLQELLANVIKHSKASRLDVQLYTNKNQLILMVEDNGVGLHQNQTSGKPDTSGMGLSGIRSRLGSINGAFSIQPGTESGTFILIKIPIS